MAHEFNCLSLAAGILLLAGSVGINLRGATAQSTWWWNVRPNNVDGIPNVCGTGGIRNF